VRAASSRRAIFDVNVMLLEMGVEEFSPVEEKTKCLKRVRSVSQQVSEKY